jgi:phosphatidylglycerophosphate synthase
MDKVPPIKDLEQYAWKFKNKKTEAHLRVFSPYLLWSILHTKVTPNQLTTFWTLLVLVASPFFLIFNQNLHLILGAIMLFALQLDFVDGALARYKRMFSKKGVIIDFIGSWALATLPPLFIAISFYYNTDKTWVLVAAVFLLLGFAMKELIPLKEMVIYNKKIKDQKEEKKNGKYKVYSIIRKCLLVEFPIEALFIAVFLGIQEYYVLFFAISYNILWVSKTVHVIVKKESVSKEKFLS